MAVTPATGGHSHRYVSRALDAPGTRAGGRAHDSGAPDGRPRPERDEKRRGGAASTLTGGVTRSLMSAGHREDMPSVIATPAPERDAAAGPGASPGAGARRPGRAPPPPRPSPRRRPLGGAGVRAGGRGDPSPARADPIDRRALAASYRREAFRVRPADAAPARSITGPTTVAYAVRWLELGDGAAPTGLDRSRRRARLTRPRRRARYPSRMRLSHLFFTTLRDDPSDAEMPSHRLLLRAGYVRQLGSGIYSLLPLGFRVNKRVEQVIREEMDRIGSQELEMPVVHPADVWRASGRYDAIGPELGPVQGPQRPRHGPGDDPRGGRRACCWRTSSSRGGSCR